MRVKNHGNVIQQPLVSVDEIIRRQDAIEELNGSLIDREELREYLNPIYDKLFIEDSYACRKGKGSHKAAKRLQYWMRQVERKPGPGW